MLIPYGPFLRCCEVKDGLRLLFSVQTMNLEVFFNESVVEQRWRFSGLLSEGLRIYIGRLYFKKYEKFCIVIRRGLLNNPSGYP